MIGKIVLATANAGKVREFQQPLGRCGLTVVPQSQFNIVGVAETGLTFVENAILKARHAARYSGLPAIADDSGLEVDCLDGAPGIHSARFAGDNASDTQNNQRLLRLLQDVAEDERTARFQCLLVFLRNDRDPTPIICQGTWEGRLLLAPRGDQGFGYDPLFYLPELGCTAAELPAEEKNRISHRGQAMAMLLRALGP
jgi:XTP/dITP diphosphohydrolase